MLRHEPVTTHSDPVPLGLRFDLVWRGYNRRQVNEFLDMELRWLTADRDAAIALIAKLTRLLDESRAEARRLRDRFDEQCRLPLPAGAVSERIRRLVDIAHADAAAIITRARARADHIQTEATEAAAHHRRTLVQNFHTTMAAHREATQPQPTTEPAPFAGTLPTT
jgi:cell division septum initiation protein DivIVA